MKILNGFVSNSSTCSFWIYAMLYDEQRISLDVLRNKAKNDPEGYKELADKMCKSFSEVSDLRFMFDNINSLNEAGENKFERFINDDGLEYLADWYGLRVMNYYDGWDTFIGRSWQGLGDDETPNQFRTKIDGALKELFGEEAKAQSEEGEYSC